MYTILGRGSHPSVANHPKISNIYYIIYQLFPNFVYIYKFETRGLKRNRRGNETRKHIEATFKKIGVGSR